MIAVLKKVFELHFSDKKLRLVQIISIIYMLHSNNNIVFSEIATGEGKS
jgi:hypothetical protein